MGFSVSGATALLFVAFLLSFGTFYTATMGAVEQVQEAEVDTQEQSIETLNTEIEIQSAKYNASGQKELTIVANNTGAEPLQPTSLSLLVNGTFTAFGQDNVSISDSPENDLWAPQQQLTITLSNSDLPATPTGGETIKLVTRTGVADTAQITVVN
jgi:flagellar protein FlaF